MISEHFRGQRTAQSITTFTSVISPGVERRTIYDAQSKQRLPGKLITSEIGDDPSKVNVITDFVAKSAYINSGATYNFYKELFKRNSIDGRGLRLDSSVHYGKNFNNAFWNGKQMVYGDGDGKLFTGFAQAVDVVAHELTHGIIQYSVPGGGLSYEDESGALNESYSDCLGILVKQWTLNLDTKDSDWLIGAGILNSQYGKALRSMAEPGTAWQGDDQPSTYDHYVPGGDVHTNSGIPNHAFYLAAMKIGGKAWEKTGRILYRSLSMLQTDSSMREAANATIAAAGLLFGINSIEQKNVQDAWKEVKVL
jgi:Zn-dependent metalloprotease